MLSVANWVETSIVIEVRYDTAGLHLLDRFLDRAAIECVPVDFQQAKEARRAFSQYGKGLHPAGLNYGECFAYALARACRLGRELFPGGSGHGDLHHDGS